MRRKKIIQKMHQLIDKLPKCKQRAELKKKVLELKLKPANEPIENIDWYTTTT
jgi:hypothetical protein|tara:strand:+ start:340 stop:498 length:159 start_codon:yes stop_codon:yes gene_type:complete